jgi:MFS family permease
MGTWTIMTIETRWNPTRRLDAVVAASFLATGIVVATVPRFLRSEFQATRSQTGLATTGFFLAALFFRPFVGRGIERYGRSIFLRWAMLATGILSLGFVFANAISAVAALRIAQGAAGAAFYTAALTTATDLAPADKRASAVARLSVTVYLGFTLGPLIADLLIRGPGFQTVWVLVIALYFVGFGLSWFVPETGSPQHGARLRTVAPLHLALDSAALDVTSLESTSLETALLNPAPLEIALPEVSSSNPHQSSAGKPRFAEHFPRSSVIPGIAMLATALTFSTITIFTPDYADNMGIARPGMLLAFYAIAVLVVRVVASPIVDRRNAYVVVLPAMILAGSALTAMAVSRSSVLSFAAITFVGVGAGATFPALSSMAVQGVEAAKRATALSAFLMFNDIGQAVAGPLVGFVSDAFGWRWVFGIPALVTFSALSILLFARRRGAVAPVVR